MAKRKKARSDDAEVVLKELLRGAERAHAGNLKRWVQVGDLDFPYTPTQLKLAIAVAEQTGPAARKPAHMIAFLGRREAEHARILSGGMIFDARFDDLSKLSVASRSAFYRM